MNDQIISVGLKVYSAYLEPFLKRYREKNDSKAEEGYSELKTLIEKLYSAFIRGTIAADTVEAINSRMEYLNESLILINKIKKYRWGLFKSKTSIMMMSSVGFNIYSLEELIESVAEPDDLRHDDSADIARKIRDFVTFIDKTEEYLKDRINKLQYEKRTLKLKAKRTENGEKLSVYKKVDSKSKLFRDRISVQKVRITKKKIYNEIMSYYEKENRSDYKYNIYYLDSLKLMQQLLSEEDVNIFDCMKRLEESMILTIAFYTDSYEVGRDNSHLRDINIEQLIGQYESAYKIFLKKVKRLSKSDCEKMLEEAGLDAYYDLGLFNTSNMIASSNKQIAFLMSKRGEIYQQGMSSEDDRLSTYGVSDPINMITYRISRMSYDEIRYTYYRIIEEFEKNGRSYSDFHLQDNFIRAICNRMKLDGILKENQELTEEIQERICNEILHCDIIETKVK